MHSEWCKSGQLYGMPYIDVTDVMPYAMPKTGITDSNCSRGWELELKDQPKCHGGCESQVGAFVGAPIINKDQKNTSQQTLNWL